MSPIPLVSPEINFINYLITPISLTHLKAFLESLLGVPIFPLHVLMTYTLTKFLFEFNLESS